ncbi:hypothetical protein J1N09_04195 [Aureitalea sp. L0-47]|uniref:hypothetical protein n=1 Tax=Aureitalea sp. L0-47 TaxID=2816962 RepID=UPI0022374301|nr:hypothetical protein [Aureitalea sp. L0-47]MCW5519025.1 hypothetical protein [Aureitalea sp. L0-47]
MIAGSMVYINRMQEIISDFDGTVISSNDAIHSIELGTNIFMIHPFFESLKGSLDTRPDIYFTFPCINLSMGGKDYYCDVIIKKEKNFVAILLFNYSDHYNEVREKIQKINSEKLNS